MRVISGRARGTRLLSPHGMHTRPTADRVKEALFSIIQSRFDLANAVVLDICAGSGSLGIEALSRGAALCSFIENDRSAVISLRKNLAAADCTEHADLLEMDALKALRLLAGRRKQYDIIFFDPPYASGLYLSVAEMLSDSSMLTNGGLLIAESASRDVLPERMGCLVKIDRRVYGDTALDLYLLEGI